MAYTGKLRLLTAEEQGDLLAAVDWYLEATGHLFVDDTLPRSCYEYDDDAVAWEAMSSARARLKNRFLASLEKRNSQTRL